MLTIRLIINVHIVVFLNLRFTTNDMTCFMIQSGHLNPMNAGPLRTTSGQSFWVQRHRRPTLITRKGNRRIYNSKLQ